ncbi:MAG TPA: hypothetical protein VD966_09940, partial [Pyrinomonadaceae bacterium]|nr:hypothetical protein [Pyrinomonadaceae bacterium]
MSISSARRIWQMLALALVVWGAQVATLAQTPQISKINLLRSGEASEASRLTITSGAPITDYAAYKSDGRFYIVIRGAGTPHVQGGDQESVFAEAQMQQRGDETIISFRLPPGTNARVNQSPVGLEVIFAASDEAANVDTQETRPTQNPAQREATKPPGTQQNPTIPEQAQPTTQDPTAPPGTQRPAPQAPPGTTTTTPQTEPTTPGVVPVTPAPQTTTEPSTTTGTGTAQEQRELEILAT